MYIFYLKSETRFELCIRKTFSDIQSDYLLPKEERRQYGGRKGEHKHDFSSQMRHNKNSNKALPSKLRRKKELWNWGTGGHRGTEGDTQEERGTHAFRGEELHWSIFNSLSKIDMRLMMFVEMCGVGRCMLLVVAASVAALDLNLNYVENFTWLKSERENNKLGCCVCGTREGGGALLCYQFVAS